MNQDNDKQEGSEELTEALEATLSGLNNSIEKMEEIVRRIEAGDPDWQENMELLAEANELAAASNQKLDEVVQDVVYGSDEDDDEAEPVEESRE